jgi:hypothetical protein
VRSFLVRYRQQLFLSALMLLSLSIRLAHAGPYAESWDAVDFALALERFDIFHMQPHFPGYPLYILAAHLFWPFAGQPVLALTWLSACFGSLSLLPFYSLAKRLLPSQPAVWFAMLLFATSPLLGLAHVQPMSEAMGLFAVLTFFAVLVRSLDKPLPFADACVGAVLFALILGIRISYFPVGFLLLHPLVRLYQERSGTGRFLLQAATVSCLFLLVLAGWLLPTAATEGGLVPYWELGKAFTAGHFTDWGGTSFSSDVTWGERLKTILWDRLWCNGLIGAGVASGAPPLPSWFVPGLSVSFLTLASCGAFNAAPKKENRSVRRFLLLAVIPYGLWVFLGQNSEKARHLLPLLPWLYLLLARGWDVVRCRWKRPAGAWGLWILTVGLLASLMLRQWTVLQQHLLPPPSLQLVTFVQEHFHAQDVLIYTWEEQRLFDYYAPDYQTERLRSYSYFVQSLQLRSHTVSCVLVTNTVLDGFGPGLYPHVRELARFTADPFLYPTYHSVVLYELPTKTVERIIEGTVHP